MGLDIGDLAVRHTISLDSLSGRVVAVDAFNILYQFLSSIRQEDGSPLMDFKGRITAHLSGLFYRNSKLLENGLRPVYVFDGKPPPFKARTQEERAEAKRNAEAKWKEALAQERTADARKFAQATSRLTHEMIEESKKLLGAMGIPCVQAPSEGEAQSAAMVREGVAYASVSQDYDSLLFGSPLLVRNLSITGRRKVPRQDRFVLVEPEKIVLDETLNSVGITREQLVMMGLLIGNEFNEGIRGIGPKKALKAVLEVKTLEGVKKFAEEKKEGGLPDYIDEVYDFFLNPPVAKTPKLEFGKPDAGKIEDMLVKEHDFAPERINSVLAKLQASMKERGAQKKLDEWA